MKKGAKKEKVSGKFKPCGCGENQSIGSEFLKIPETEDELSGRHQTS
jgi:hypothetical protein